MSAHAPHDVGAGPSISVDGRCKRMQDKDMDNATNKVPLVYVTSSLAWFESLPVLRQRRLRALICRLRPSVLGLTL